MEHINKALGGKTPRGELARTLWPLVKTEDEALWVNVLFARSSYSSVDILKIIQLVKNGSAE